MSAVLSSICPVRSSVPERLARKPSRTSVTQQYAYTIRKRRDNGVVKRSRTDPTILESDRMSGRSSLPSVLDDTDLDPLVLELGLGEVHGHPVAEVLVDLHDR